MSGYSVRPMQVADAESVADVHVRVWRETYPGLMSAAYLDALDVAEFAQSWRERLADLPPDTSFLVGIAPDGAIVGFGVAGPSRDEDPPVPRELWAINVLATAHGTGLGNQLILELMGDGAASLWVAEGNARARAFYARHGFVPDGSSQVRGETEAAEVRLVRV